MSLDLSTCIGKTLQMYSNSTLYQSGIIESVNGNLCKLSESSLTSPIADLSTHIYERTAECSAGWYVLQYYDVLAECHTNEIYSAVQTRSVWISFDYEYKIYHPDPMTGQKVIMPPTKLLAYYDYGLLKPGIHITFIGPSGQLINSVSVCSVVDTDFSGTYSGPCIDDFFGELWDSNFQLHCKFTTPTVKITREGSRGGETEIKISNINFFNCRGEPIDDGHNCLILRTFTGVIE
jgi:hypothetical protein